MPRILLYNNHIQCKMMQRIDKVSWFHFSSFQSLSHVQLFVTLWTAARQASLSITNSQSLLKLMSIKSVMPSNHFILCHPLLLLPSIFPSIRVYWKNHSFHWMDLCWQSNVSAF